MRAIALILTVLTGFTGLVYQVTWQKYLAVLLGSHSEATAAVLGIFLGGLSYGYLLFGRVSRRLVARAPESRGRTRVMLAYGLVEAAIGVWALGFGPLFALARQASLAVPPSVGQAAFAVDVGITALLIGPPTILMGATIPLLTQALARSLDEATRFHSWVYAFNTTGAFAGALCGGFLLIPNLGLQGTLVAMSGLDVLAGCVYMVLAIRLPDEPGVLAAPSPEPGAAGTGGGPAFVALTLAAGTTGFAMMTLQTTLNRIGALSLGASQFTFAMAVAIFVLCIALGAFAVSALPRIPRLLLPASQWVLVVYGLCLYPFVPDAPYWAHRLRIHFGLQSSDFLPFHAAVLGTTLLVLVVPLALSGALLPLVFHELRRRRDDLGRIAGSLYSANTVGSLLGALLGGYALLFWLDLHAVYRIAMLALAASATLLCVRPGGLSRRLLPAGGFALTACILVALPAWSPVKLSAGLFRMRKPFAYSYAGPNRIFELKERDLGKDFVEFYRDDPIASIAVQRSTGGSLSILTNGKSDGNIPRDDTTQGLLGLLPALTARNGKRAFVIGYGTGMTVGTLDALDSFDDVEVAEISPAVLQAARIFEGRNGGALHNPKTHVIRTDAYRALLRSPGGFDVIVSEPSNPWVTGVEMLYSVEFLKAVHARLAPGGVFAQWFQLYETDDRSVDLVLRSYLQAFDRVAVWHGKAPDLILLGFSGADGSVDLDRLERRFARPDFARQLAGLGITSLPRLLAHELLPAGALQRSMLPGPLHTLNRPILSHIAALAFFRGSDGHLPVVADASTRAPSIWRRYRARFPGGRPTEADRLELMRETCRYSLTRCSTLFAEWLYEDPTSPALAESLRRARTDRALAGALDENLLRTLASWFDPDETNAQEPPSAEWERYFDHAAPFAPRVGEATAAATHVAHRLNVIRASPDPAP